MNKLQPYPQADCGSTLAEPASIQQRLTQQKQELEKRLHKVNLALEAMHDQPQVALLIERIMKVI